jgi:hypothetical protein
VGRNDNGRKKGGQYCKKRLKGDLMQKAKERGHLSKEIKYMRNQIRDALKK